MSDVDNKKTSTFQYQTIPITDRDSYIKLFGKTQNKALEKALDIRKFEIELYWKRAGYFWTFIALTFTSYFLILTSDKLTDTIKAEFCLLLAALGVFLSICWYLVNKGSKYWQENWEKHVDLLEDAEIGPLYKTTIKYEEKWWTIFNPVAPQKFSVGKINQTLSFAIVLIWIFIFIKQLSTIFGWYEPLNHLNEGLIMITLAGLLVFISLKGKSSTKNGNDFSMEQRKFKSPETKP